MSSWIDSTSAIDADVSRDSVYRIAAGGSSLPSEPKLPCPSISGSRMENGCAIRTTES